MSVRTSAVVGIGLGLLTAVGVGTVFGETIVAVVFPPAVLRAADTVADTAPRPSVTPPAGAPGATPAVPSPAPADGVAAP
ncbi:MAG: hypothetical protein ABUR63_04660 [Verrucomicrobiota bacterium]